MHGRAHMHFSVDLHAAVHARPYAFACVCAKLCGKNQPQVYAGIVACRISDAGDGMHL